MHSEVEEHGISVSFDVDGNIVPNIHIQVYADTPPGPGKAVVYVGQCKVTKKLYIGKHNHGRTGRSVRQDRWKPHVRNKDSPCIALKRAIQCHGSASFVWFVVEHVDEHVVAKRESLWIRSLNTIAPNGYNLLSNDDRTAPSEETLERMSAGAKRACAVPGRREAMSQQAKHQWAVTGYRDNASIKMNSFYQTDRGAELKANTSKRMKVVFSDPCVREKLSKSQKQRLEDPETKRTFVERLVGSRSNTTTKQKLSDSKIELWNSDGYRTKFLGSNDMKREAKETELLAAAVDDPVETAKLKRLFKKRERKRNFERSKRGVWESI